MISRTEVKYIQSLSQKKFRDAENLFIVEGPKIIDEALHINIANIKKIFALPQWIDEHKQYANKINIAAIDEVGLSRISQLKTPNDVVALMEKPWSEGFILNNQSLALALDGIQDPGNMGTLLRIADWFGVKQIICSNNCADIYNHKVVQASMGSIFRVEVLYTELQTWLPAQKEAIIYGAAFEGEALHKVGKINSGILVIGNEGAGISKEVLALISKKITIERIGSAESLNAAVATGIILSHIV